MFRNLQIAGRNVVVHAMTARDDITFCIPVSCISKAKSVGINL